MHDKYIKLYIFEFILIELAMSFEMLIKINPENIFLIIKNTKIDKNIDIRVIVNEIWEISPISALKLLP